MNYSNGANSTKIKSNQNIQVYVRVRPINSRERSIRSHEVVEVASPNEIVAKQMLDSKMSKKFTFDRAFGPDSRQSEVYNTVVAPLIGEVLAGYNCTVFAYGQTGTGKTHTMIGTECPELKSSWEDESLVGIIPRALTHLFDELRMMEVEFSMRISYLELYNEELCDLLSSDDTTKIRIYDDANRKGSLIIQGLEEIPVHSKDDVYKLLEKGKERRKTATTLMNAQSSRSHTVFSILVHIKENGMDGEEMLKIGKLNLVDLAGSENISKSGNEKGIRTRETVNINQSLLTLGRVITALVEKTPHVPYRESKLTRLLQESLGGRTKTSIIATVSPGHKDLEETLSTLDYAHRAKNIQNKPEINQKLTKRTVLKEYTEEIDRLKRDLLAARDKNGIYLPEDTFNGMHYKLDSLTKELNEKMLAVKALKDDLRNKEQLFNEVSLQLIDKCEELKKTEKDFTHTRMKLEETKKVLILTKRRYKEKEHLLDTHIETEKQLTNQGTKLIQVADVAVGDTHLLHNTIERRKHVDVNIKSACKVFVSKMENTFEDMNFNLDSLLREHSSCSEVIMDEIGENSAAYKHFSMAAMNTVKCILEKHVTSLNEVRACLEKYSLQFCDADSEHRTAFLALLNDLKIKENDLKSNFEKHFSEMLQLLNQQRLIVTNNCLGIAERVTESNRTVTEVSSNAKSRLSEFYASTKSSLESDIAAIANSIEARKNFSQQRDAALENFMKEMKSIKEQEIIDKEHLQSVSENIEQIRNRIDENNLYEMKALEELSQKDQATCKSIENIVSKLKMDTNDCIEKGTSSITSAKEILMDNVKDKENTTVCLQEMDESHLNNSSELFESFKRDQLANEESFKEHITSEVGNITTLIDKETDRVMKYQTQNRAFNKCLQDSLQDYSTQYNVKLTDCKNQLKTFENNELKIYTPTGQTPSRKDFTYPRVLAVTSPDINIIRRFRMEKSWSDDDTPITITEDSENCLPDLGDELGTYSTPIKPDTDENTASKLNEIKTESNCSISQLLTNFDDQSLSRKNSSALRYNTENKENCEI